jgi:O-antigen/teichoic acid export membrane protein
MTAAGTFFFLNHGYGLRGLVYNNAIITLFTVVANVFVAWRLFPALRINPFLFFRYKMLKTIFAFSWKVQISILSQLFVYQLDRILLSRYLGLSSVATYEVANRLATQARTFLASIFTPIIPAASTLYAQDDRTRIIGLYNRAFKYLAVTTIPFSFLIISLAHPFVRTWLGEGFEKTAVTIQFLMAAYLVNLVPGPGSFILSGMNKPEITMKASVLAGGINLIACVILVQTIGYYGVIIGITTSLVVSAGYFLFELHRNIPQLTWRLYGDAMIKPAVVSSLLSIILVCTQGIFDLRGYVALVITSAIYLLLYAITIVYKSDYLDEYDRALLYKLISRPI